MYICENNNNNNNNNNTICIVPIKSEDTEALTSLTYLTYFRSKNNCKFSLQLQLTKAIVINSNIQICHW